MRCYNHFLYDYRRESGSLLSAKLNDNLQFLSQKEVQKQTNGSKHNPEHSENDKGDGDSDIKRVDHFICTSIVRISIYTQDKKFICLW